jgi:hypothetical protein
MNYNNKKNEYPFYLMFVTFFNAILSPFTSLFLFCCS